MNKGYFYNLLEKALAKTITQDEEEELWGYIDEWESPDVEFLKFADGVLSLDLLGIPWAGMVFFNKNHQTVRSCLAIGQVFCYHILMEGSSCIRFFYVLDICWAVALPPL